MPQLPTVGQTNWGSTLNNFLQVAHDNTNTADGGKIKPEAIKTTGADKVLVTDTNSVPSWMDKSSVGGETSSNAGVLLYLDLSSGNSNNRMNATAVVPNPYGSRYGYIPHNTPAIQIGT